MQKYPHSAGTTKKEFKSVNKRTTIHNIFTNVDIYYLLMDYIICLDMENPYNNDYGFIYSRIKHKFSKSYQILSTTFLIKSNHDIESIRDWFQTCTSDENNISVFVVECENYSAWLDRITIKHIDKLLK